MPRQEREGSETGVTVYPRLPVPKPREGGEPRQDRKQRPLNKLLLGVVSVVFVAGVVLGAVVRPLVLPDPRIALARKQAEDASLAAAAQKTRADGLEKDLDAASAKKREVEKRLEVASKAETKLADTAAEAEKRAKELDAVQKKLGASLRGIAAVAVDGPDLRVTINTGFLFVKDDALSVGGKQIIDRVGSSLKEMLDKRIAVYGHTDDAPLPLPKPAPAPAPPKKGQRPAPAAPPPPLPRFATNWELSAGRAVAVVRQLQEVSKIDPGRLSAAGFGQYQPISRRDRNANRRIEIVLSPKPK
ncbi:MAG TPA: OmpA family protein [Kofleriaceae bacterium]|nr:OmpA family protein [Kofleriaceae bacterium]